MNWKDANTTEIDSETPYPVVIDMPEHNPGQMGGTMRLGKRTTIFHGDSILSIFYYPYLTSNCILDILSYFREIVRKRRSDRRTPSSSIRSKPRIC